MPSVRGIAQAPLALQLPSAVRDASEQAVEVLRSMGYEVTEPASSSMAAAAPAKLYLP